MPHIEQGATREDFIKSNLDDFMSSLSDMLLPMKSKYAFGDILIGLRQEKRFAYAKFYAQPS